MTQTKTEDKIGNVLKADLILSDYTLTTDSEDKSVLLNLLDHYIEKIDNRQTQIIFDRITTVENVDEKDLYIEILTDIFSDYKHNFH